MMLPSRVGYKLGLGYEVELEEYPKNGCQDELLDGVLAALRVWGMGLSLVVVCAAGGGPRGRHRQDGPLGGVRLPAAPGRGGGLPRA